MRQFTYVFIYFTLFLCCTGQIAVTQVVTQPPVDRSSRGLQPTPTPVPSNATPEIQPHDPTADAATVDQSATTPQSSLADQTEFASAASPAEQITRETVSQKIEEVQAYQDLDEGTKAEHLKRCKAAQQWLKTAEEARQRADEYQADIQRAPEALENAKRDLAQHVKEPVAEVPSDASLAQIEQFASEAEASLRTAQDALVKREEEVKGRGDRKNEIARLTEETRQRLEETQKQLQTKSSADESEVLANARRLEMQARSMALESQLVLYRVEAARHDAYAELLPLTRDIAKRNKQFCEMHSLAWQQIVATRRKRESERQAAEASRQVHNTHPALRALAERNSVLATQRNALAKSIAQLGQQLTSVNKQVETLQQQFQKAELRVRRAGHSSTVGLMLRRQKEELPSRSEWAARVRQIQTEMPLANLALIELEEERDAIGDLDSTVLQVIADLDTSSAGLNAEQLEDMVRELQKTKLDLLGSLITDSETYLDDLAELEVSNGKLNNQLEKMLAYVGEHVFWIRSSRPLWVDDVRNATQGVAAIFAYEQWLGLAKHCGLDTIQRPLAALSVLLVVILIVVSQRKLRARMLALCGMECEGQLDRIRPTLQAILLAAIISAEWPLLLAYFGWRMSFAEAAQELTIALGAALQYAALLLWVSDFFENVLRIGGLAESHFGWSTRSAQLLRHSLRWLTILGIPLAVLVVGLEHFQERAWSDSLGRIAFVFGMLLLAYFMHSLLNARDNILREAISRDNGNWFAGLRAIAHAVGIAIPCILALLAAAGYYYSAQQVAIRWQATLGVALALLLGYSVAARWSLVKRRNLARQQADQHQQQATEDVAGAAAAATAGPVGPIDEQQPDPSVIHEQLRYLLRHAVTVCMIVASWFIWADILPALKVLDRVVLWENMVEVIETHETVDGKLERTVEEVPVTTTLRHALFAGLFVIATFIIVRNLPALLEVTVLPNLPFDRGGRYAISVLFKYTVAMLGLFLAFRTLSISWSSVQWLAAGMTVGLGFGLQEIFANFVSGLILLFERPIRVGDVITLGDVTGIVSNMRMRATTVRNWECKELIVPNKDLITGRLLNWTLSDTTSRIVVTVGVAYDSDPQLARDLLLETVTAHPNVLEDPKPNVTFEEFGDSALNLVVRAYVARLDVRLATIHELHTSIHKTLKEAKIEIAFPQQDIHLRGLEQVLMPKFGETRRGAA